MHNTDSQPETILEVRSLHAGYPVRSGVLHRVRGWNRVLRDISLKIREGRTLGLVGESGCGKTTLGRAILGLAPVIEGSIVYHSKQGPVNLEKLPERHFRPLRKELQIIFQDPFSSLNPMLSVEEILMEGVRIHFPEESATRHRERCRAALEQVGLPSSASGRFPHEFSGGQRQRISIARAVVLEPRFIVCDESVSALDVSIQAQILNLLIDLQDRFGIAYLFISHDLSVVRHISHEIAVIDRGSIVEYGSSSSVIDSPAHEYTQKLLAAVPQIRF